MSTVDTSSTSAEEFDGPSAAAVEALSKRLDSWRKSLPLDLQWPEEDPTAFPIAAQMSQSFSNAVDPAFKPPQQSQPGQTLFSTDLDQDAPQYQYLYDIQVAVLRTSYYYAKYMVHRPLLYKALHFPNDMTQEDAEGVAACLQVSFKSLSTEAKMALKSPSALLSRRILVYACPYHHGHLAVRASFSTHVAEPKKSQRPVSRDPET
jgi:hypothetical protein